MVRVRLYYISSLYLATLALASSGDRSWKYQNCVRICELRNCRQSRSNLPLPLLLTRWTCTDDCKYTCMHQITDEEERNGYRIQQYYGKWPFWRLWGIQEPASVAFSLLNFWAHAKGYTKVKYALPRAHPIRKYLLCWSIISLNAWFWSSIFHTRDLPVTEKFDYFSAALAIISALHFTVTRFLFLGERRKLYFQLWTAACILAFMAHVSYLSFSERFDYSYNIIFNLILGLLHNLLWMLYSLPSSLTVIRRFPSPFVPRSYRPQFAYKATLCVLLTTFAMSLELLDFPPWLRLLDAHALWHLSTVPIALLWYDFLIQDGLDEGWKYTKL